VLTRALHELLAAGLEPVPVEIGHMLARAAIDLLENACCASCAHVELAALIDGAHERSRLGHHLRGSRCPAWRGDDPRADQLPGHRELAGASRRSRSCSPPAPDRQRPTPRNHS
jgi:hypothetical protein